MGILPLFIIIISALNDILDFVFGFFPGVNEVISFLFNALIGMLVFLEMLKKKIAGQGGIMKMIMKRIVVLLLTMLAELPIIGLLPFQSIGATVMAFLSKSEDREHAIKVAKRLRRQQELRIRKEQAEMAKREAMGADDPELMYS